MIVRDILNTRPPEVLAAWLNGLGSFDELTPRDAAGRWGCSITEAMERLHAMTGGPLEIPAGAIETYRRAAWTAEIGRNPATGMPANERDELRLQRLAMIPDAGATKRELEALWRLSPGAAEAVMGVMKKRNLIRLVRVGKCCIWRRI